MNVNIDSNGQVISAEALSGHPLLRKAAETAAKGARFSLAASESHRFLLIYRFKDENRASNPCCESYPYVIEVTSDQPIVETVTSVVENIWASSEQVNCPRAQGVATR